MMESCGGKGAEQGWGHIQAEADMLGLEAWHHRRGRKQPSKDLNFMFSRRGLVIWGAGQFGGRTPFPGLSANSQGRLSRRQPPCCHHRRALSTLSAYPTPRVQTCAGHRLPLLRALRGPDNPGPLLGTGAPGVLKTKVPKQGCKKIGACLNISCEQVHTLYTHTPNINRRNCASHTIITENMQI